MKKYALLPTLIILGLISTAGFANAPWSTIGTGFAITSNVHGIDIPPATAVTVTAGTLDSRVTHVTFRWHMPNDTVARQVIVPVFTNGTTDQWNNGTVALVRFAIDTYSASVLGDWGVQAFFQDSVGTARAGLEDVIKIRATSFNVIPEVPFGTLMILIGMFGALGVLSVRRKKQEPAK